MKESVRRRRLADHLAVFMIDVGKQHGPKKHEPNDRLYSPEFSRWLRRMDPAELDRLLRGELGED